MISVPVKRVDTTSVIAGHISKRNSEAAGQFDSALTSAERLLHAVREKRRLKTSYTPSPTKEEKRKKYLEEQAELRKKQKEEEARIQVEFLQKQKELREQQLQLSKEAESSRHQMVTKMIESFGEKRKEGVSEREAERERLREEDKQRKEEVRKEREKREKLEMLQAKLQQLQLDAEVNLQQQKLLKEKEERDKKLYERQKGNGLLLEAQFAYLFPTLASTLKNGMHHSLTQLEIRSTSPTVTISPPGTPLGVQPLRIQTSRSSSIDVLVDPKFVERRRSISQDSNNSNTSNSNHSNNGNSNDYELDYKPVRDGITPPVDKTRMLEAEKNDFYEGAIVYIRYQKARVERIDWPLIFYRLYNPHIHSWDDISREACTPILEDGMKFTLGPEKHRNFVYTVNEPFFFTVDPETRDQNSIRTADPQENDGSHEEDRPRQKKKK